MKSLGIDIGSSSVKVSLLDVETGRCIASCTAPREEMPIKALRPGWAEQDPEMWWKYVREGIRGVAAAVASAESSAATSASASAKSSATPAREAASAAAASRPLSDLASIGITYQMHGLVPVDKSGRPVRDAIIWCDSRAVELGREAFQGIGQDYCLSHFLNSPGNFTASKLAWVKRNEPDLFAKIHKVLLPGDYIAYKLSGEMSTTIGGLSEQVLWDFSIEGIAHKVLDYYGIPRELYPEIVPGIGTFAQTTEEIRDELGIPAGTPISYRAGDQPNNAFSLNVLNPGEIAATGGTSGVVYGVTDSRSFDPQSRVNTFAHVNHLAADPAAAPSAAPEKAPRYGVLLCINGTGILNSWTRRHIALQTMDYAQMNEAASGIPAGCDGLTILPFGNGAERILGNNCPGATITGIDFNRHTTAHILRAVQEGIAFSFRYGIDIMKDMGLKPDVIRAGKANLFLSPVFRDTLSTIVDARIELYDTDGALGAARGGALGAGLYRTPQEAFATLTKVGEVLPTPSIRPALDQAYARWRAALARTE